MLTAEKRQLKLRLQDIDVLGTGQYFGARAKQAAFEMAFGRQITVREMDKDRYGRTVAEIMLPDGRTLNRELVRVGMAWWYRIYAPADRDLASLGAGAKSAKRGFWAQANPVPPWGWRNGRGVLATARVVGNRYRHLYSRPELPWRRRDEREKLSSTHADSGCCPGR
jgi:endonuclease YncB( thermonuclease family)